MTKTQETLLNTILSIATEQQTNEFVYRSHMIWDFPQHAIYINDKMLHPRECDIPLSFSSIDLDELVSIGYFDKIKEIVIDEITLETEIIYSINTVTNNLKS